MSAISETNLSRVLDAARSPPVGVNLTEQKVRGIFTRMLQSSLFRAGVVGALGVGAAITFSVLVLTGVAGRPMIALAIPIAGAGVVLFGLALYYNRYELFYESTLNGIVLLNKVNKYDWHNEIVPGELVLGAIPLKNMGHDHELKGKEVGAVLSMVMPFETNDPSLLADPVSEKSWKNQGIKYNNLPTPDLGAPSQQDIVKGVAHIKENADQDKKTYVHCKAGVGRSATIVISYLLTHKRDLLNQVEGEDPVERAMAYVKGRRVKMSLSAVQKDAICTYAKSIGIDLSDTNQKRVNSKK